MERKLMPVWLISGVSLVTAATTWATSLPNDPLISQQDYLFTQFGGIGAPEAWAHAEANGGLEEVVVAIIGTGIDLNHEDLKNRLWTNPNEIPGNRIDDDNNGFVDDVHGWNFSSDSGDVQDTDGSGTFFAGIIAAEHNNGVGIAGIAPNARIMTLVNASDDDTHFADAGFNRAFDFHPQKNTPLLEYAIAEGADLIVFGVPGFGRDGPDHEDATAVLAAAGVPLVEKFNGYSSAYTSDEAVFLNLLDWHPDSVWGPRHGDPTELEIGYPNIEFAVSPTAYLSTTFEDAGSYEQFSGWRYAYGSTAVLAGAIAVMQGAYPNDELEMLRTRIATGASPDPDLRGLIFAEGQLQLDKAIKANPGKLIQRLKAFELRDYNLAEATPAHSPTTSAGLDAEVQVVSGPAEVQAGKLRFLDAGDVTITLGHPGNADYAPIESQEFRFRINPKGQRIIPSQQTSLTNTSPLKSQGVIHFDSEMILRVLKDGNRASSFAIEVLKPFLGRWARHQTLQLPFATTLPDLEMYFGATYTDGVLMISARDEDESPHEGTYIYLWKNDSFVFQQRLLPPAGTRPRAHILEQTADRAVILFFDEPGQPEHLYFRDAEGNFQRRANPFELNPTRVRMHGDWIAAEVFREGVYILQLDENHQETLRQRITPQMQPLALNDEWLILGDPTNSDRYRHAGALQVYRKGEDDRFHHHQTLYADDAFAGQRFGEIHNSSHLVNLDDSWLAIVAIRGADIYKQHDEGYVYRWDTETEQWKFAYRAQWTGEPFWNPRSHRFPFRVEDDKLYTWREDTVAVYDLASPQLLPQSAYLVGDTDPVKVDAPQRPLEATVIGEGQVALHLVSGPARIEDGTLVFTGDAGEVVFTVQAEGTWGYAASPLQEYRILVERYAQEIPLPATMDPMYLGATALPPLVATSALPLDWEVLSGGVETVEEALSTVGAYRLRVSQPGNALFSPAPAQELDLEVRPIWRRSFDPWLQAQGGGDSFDAPSLDANQNGRRDMDDYFLPNEPGLAPSVTMRGRFVRIDLPYRTVEGAPPISLERYDTASGTWEFRRSVDQDHSEATGMESLLLRVDDEPALYRLRLGTDRP